MKLNVNNNLKKNMSYYSLVIIPARKNSKGFPMKNRLYFNKTAKFVKSLKWFEK